MKKTIFSLTILSAATFLLCTPSSFAEGSRDLVGYANADNLFVNYSGYRPYMEESTSYNASLERRTTVYVYANKGETVSFGSSVVYDNRYSGNFAATGSEPLRPVDMIRNNLNAISSNKPFTTANDWISWNCADKYATIAVTVHSPNASEVSSLTKVSASLSDYVSGDNIQYATSDNLNKTIYLFSPQSGSETRYVYSNGSKNARDVEGESYGSSAVQKGYIANTTQEKYGPNGIITPGKPNASDPDITESGYIPLSFTAPMDGTYAFHFFAPTYVGGDTNPLCDDLSTSDDDGNVFLERFHQNSDTPSDYAPDTVGMWDVTVSSSDNKAITGRLWTDFMHMNMGGQDYPLYTNFYTLTKDGFEYAINLNGMEPYGFTFFSNNRGFLIDHDGKNNKDYYQSLNHSYFSRSGYNVGTAPTRTDVDSDGKAYSSPIYTNTRPMDSTKDINHKIFFNRADSAAIEKYTDSGLKNTITNPITDYEVKFTGEGYSRSNWEDETKNESNYVTDSKTGEIKQYNKGSEGIGGYFTVTVPTSQLTQSGLNTLSIKIDLSGYKLDENKRPIRDSNGEWQTNGDNPSDAEQGNHVILTSSSFTATSNTNSNGEPLSECRISWSGRDSYDNIVPPGVYDKIITSYWQSGTAHFPFIDVEHNKNGIKMKMLNDIGEDSERDKVYYNNSASAGNSSSSWYFSIDGKKAYFSDNMQIGDGLNRSDGVSSNFDSSVVDNGASKFSGTYNASYMTESGQTALLNNLAYGDNTAIDLWMRYSTTPQNTGLIIGINPHTSLRDSSNPYVSFVAEDKDKLLNGLTTHVGYYTDDDSDTNESWKYTEYPGYYGADGDENYYGNTVSTEFVTTITPSDSYSYSKLRWTIELPAEGTYVKADKNITNLSLANSAKAVFGEPVLSDSDNVKVNSGAVYPITAFNETDKFTTLQLIYNLNTVITGDSAITFGLFIDNLYAPKARATEVRFENSAYADDDSYIAIGENSNSAAQGIFSSDAKGYYANENNEYWTYDPENPNRKQ